MWAMNWVIFFLIIFLVVHLSRHFCFHQLSLVLLITFFSSAVVVIVVNCLDNLCRYWMTEMFFWGAFSLSFWSKKIEQSYPTCLIESKYSNLNMICYLQIYCPFLNIVYWIFSVYILIMHLLLLPPKSQVWHYLRVNVDTFSFNKFIFCTYILN